MQKIFAICVGFTLSLCAIVAPWASAEPVNIGQLCWYLRPYADTIELDVTQPDEHIPHFVFPAAWQGLTAYTLEGGGTGHISPSGRVAALTLTVDNPSRFFRGHHVCGLHVVVTLSDLGGYWMTTCGGAEPNPLFLSGSLERRDCAVSMAILNDIARAEALRFGISPRLAGD